MKRLFKIITQLGLTQVGLFVLYKLGLKTGYFKHKTNSQLTTPTLRFLFDFPSKEELLSILGKDGLKNLITEADHIVDGEFRIFGGELVNIKLDLNHRLSHWTDYETGKARIPNTEYRKLNTALNLPPATCDLKLLWEPARFGWVFTLGRAYLATGNEQYAKTFWCSFKVFDEANPVNMGPNWMNGQEVALRMMAYVWAAQIFANATETTAERENRITQAIAKHATRITQTLLYARSQNNNHLISEAAALYTVSLALPDHPDTEKWRKLGIKWLNWSFENQIDENGEYIQHSVNYHRLVLQLALWVSTLTTKSTKGHKEKDSLRVSSWLSKKAQQNLVNATHWLAELTDPVSGNTPNLGSNDGAYIFPLANGDFRDARPVVQAASQAFLNEIPFEAGVWNEMSLWLKVEGSRSQEKERITFNFPTFKPSPDTWASLRVANGNLRLAHADQLHLDLWWRGQNIALDPGTYLYNADPPWDNPLAATKFHNTVTINGQDQMTCASRFMYLEWSRGRIIERSDRRLVAEHYGYRKLGVTHRRTVLFSEKKWKIVDDLVAHSQKDTRVYKLHWLLLDAEWELESSDEKVALNLKTNSGIITITIHSSFTIHHSPFVSLARAGELLYGNADVPPTRGWYSPTYGVRKPALSLALEITADSDVQFITEFNLKPPTFNLQPSTLNLQP